MTRLLFIILTLLLLAGCINNHPLVGRWKTVGPEGTESLLFFKPDGNFEAMIRGENLPGKWTFREDQEPNQLELVFEEGRTVVTIAKLTGDQLMLEPRENEEELPTEFTDQAQKYRRQ